MGARKYIKKALSIEQQLQFLAKQGLIIEDYEKASQVLSVISYYRFSGYLLPFKTPHNHDSVRSFKGEVTFDQVWQLYQFDRELRLLVIDAIEKIEVAFRTAITNVTSVAFSPFWYTDNSIYKNDLFFSVVAQNVEQIINDKRELFIKHYYDNYTEPLYPPIWMIMETLSFGVCVKMFRGIKDLGIRQKICATFQQHPTIMESWLQTLTYIRNICAHHSRLWNRWLVYAPIIPKNEAKKEDLEKQSRRFIVVAYIIHQLLEKIAPQSLWKGRLFALLEDYENFVKVQSMGFKIEWRSDSFWGP